MAEQAEVASRALWGAAGRVNMGWEKAAACRVGHMAQFMRLGGKAEGEISHKVKGRQCCALGGRVLCQAELRGLHQEACQDSQPGAGGAAGSG